MINQRFMPEGWEEKATFSTNEQLRNAIQTGEILQAKVSKCDDNYNLYVDLGNNIKGVIPREEVEAINIDETGFPKPNICTSKVNKLVQFKVKDIDSKNNFILSRRDVGKEALNWVTGELQEGIFVNGIVKSIQPYGVFV